MSHFDLEKIGKNWKKSSILIGKNRILRIDSGDGDFGYVQRAEHKDLHCFPFIDAMLGEGPKSAWKQRLVFINQGVNKTLWPLYLIKGDLSQNLLLSMRKSFSASFRARFPICFFVFPRYTVSVCPVYLRILGVENVSIAGAFMKIIPLKWTYFLRIQCGTKSANFEAYIFSCSSNYSIE